MTPTIVPHGSATVAPGKLEVGPFRLYMERDPNPKRAANGWFRIVIEVVSQSDPGKIHETKYLPAKSAYELETVFQTITFVLDRYGYDPESVEVEIVPT